MAVCAGWAIGGVAHADVVDDVRSALAYNNMGGAQAVLNQYKTQHGADGAYIEALSWMARGQLSSLDYAAATDSAKQTMVTQ